MVQMYVEAGALDINLKRAAKCIEEAAQNGADIALLPEVMDLGWTHPSALKLAYPVPGDMTFNFLAEAARKNKIFVCAGIVEKEGDKIYNTAVLIDNQGKLLIKHRKLNLNSQVLSSSPGEKLLPYLPKIPPHFLNSVVPSMVLLHPTSAAFPDRLPSCPYLL